MDIRNSELWNTFGLRIIVLGDLLLTRFAILEVLLSSQTATPERP
jgi:hypothetical protein